MSEQAQTTSSPQETASLQETATLEKINVLSPERCPLTGGVALRPFIAATDLLVDCPARNDYNTPKTTLSFDEFADTLLGFVSADCWAISADDDFIYNAHASTVSEILNGDLRRSQIIQTPKSLSVLMSRGTVRVVRVFMYFPGDDMHMFQFVAQPRKDTSEPLTVVMSGWIQP
jgi:hypothetical protein